MTGKINNEVAASLEALPLARLMHFTPARNLPNIFSDRQLRSVMDLKEDVRACYQVTDLRRLDGYPDKVCCSLQYPNVFYFDIARRQADAVNYPDWVYLLLNKVVAATEGTLFCPRNAAAAAAVVTPGLAGLTACYAPTVRGQGGQVRARSPRHDPASPTDIQAEVLVTAPIPLSAIEAIVFPTQEAAEEEYGRLDRFGLLPPANMRWIISEGMFNRDAVTAAVQSSRYFPDILWSPSEQTTAKPGTTS